MEKDGISMFCPKCGQLLLLKENEERESELYCVKGDMGLSQVIRQKFEERYGSHDAPQSPQPPFNQQFHGGIHWFCPGDGEKLNAHLECSTCGKHLRDVVSSLLELHPHKNEKGGYL